MNKVTAVLASVLVAGLLGSASRADAPDLDLTPQKGFVGLSQGDGTLKMAFSNPQPFHVESRGAQQGNGTFRLSQTVTFQGKSPQQRVWILTTVGPNRYSATLSDAAGPVTGSTSGRDLSLEYRVKGPFVMHQHLTLLPGRTTIDNVGVITLLGIPVGHLHETITRQTPA